MLFLSVCLLFGISVPTVFASEIGTMANEPIGIGGTCSGYDYSYYYDENEIEDLFHQKSNYTTITGFLSLALAGAGGLAVSGTAYASGLFGGVSLGLSQNADWINKAYYKDTGLLICHDGLEADDSTYNNDAYYVNLNRFYY